jgi:hypothetical protein
MIVRKRSKVSRLLQPIAGSFFRLCSPLHLTMWWSKCTGEVIAFIH